MGPSLGNYSCNHESLLLVAPHMTTHNKFEETNIPRAFKSPKSFRLPPLFELESKLL